MWSLLEKSRSFRKLLLTDAISMWPIICAKRQYVRREQAGVELRCENSFLEVLLDKFGSDVSIRSDGTEHFVARFKVYVSAGLIEWLMQYGDRAVVRDPVSLARKFRKKLAAFRAAYRD